VPPVWVPAQRSSFEATGTFWAEAVGLTSLAAPLGATSLDWSLSSDERGGGMNIEFLPTVAVIAPDPINSRNLYVEALGLPLQGEGDGYYHSEEISGCKSFGIWPLS
jgi:hypothetical protein